MDISFNGFIFPVISDMEYMVDGPDKNNPDRLFVTDCNKKFQFYFEKGFSILPRLSDSDEYKKIEVLKDNIIYLLYYPDTEKNNGKRTCYFSVLFNEKSNPCCGQLMMFESENFKDLCKSNQGIYDLISKIKLYEEVK